MAAIGTHVIVDVQHRESGMVKYRLPSFEDMVNPAAGVPRPAAGATVVATSCPICGADLYVDVLSATATAGIRLRAKLYALLSFAALIAAILVMAFVAVGRDGPGLAFLMILVAVVSLWITIAMAARIFHDGVNGPWRVAGTGRRLGISRNHLLAITRK